MRSFMITSWREMLVVAAILATSLAAAGAADREKPVAAPVPERSVTSLSTARMPRPVAGDDTYGKLPLSFEANRGQTDPKVKFISRGAADTLFLTSTEAVFVFSRMERTKERESLNAIEKRGPKAVTRTALRMKLIGANVHPRVEGHEELPGKTNYLVGRNPDKWRTNVPTYRKVRYSDVYPGIDLVFYGSGQQLEYDFVVAPDADPKRIVLAFTGANKVEIDPGGDLVLRTSAGVIRQRRPVIYQEVDGERVEISGGYALESGRRVGFRVGRYDRDKPLLIDPTLFYSTYLGGSGGEVAGGIAVDSSGDAYVTGTTDSIDFPIANALDSTADGQQDAYVTKLNATGSAVLYSTYLGGSGGEAGRSIAVDTSGNAFVFGGTGSTDFPVVSAFQSSYGGSGDAFIAKLDSTGSALVYSTYLGGSGFDTGFGIAVDLAGNASVTGSTESTDFPTTIGAFQPVPGGGINDAFVAKLSVTGSVLVFSTYLGGSGSPSERGSGIAVDASGSTYVVGNTSSPDFPTALGAFQTTFAGGGADAFVTKMSGTGAVLYSTFLGGSGVDDARAVAVDSSGNAYVTGRTTSIDFPTVNPLQGALNGQDAFVTKLNATGSALVYSTYLGGSENTFFGVSDLGLGIAVDASGNAYVFGVTRSTDFPTVPATAFQPTFGGGGDAFVSKLNSAGSALVYSSYLGGGGSEGSGGGIGLDALPSPNAYVTGDTSSTNFPTTGGAFQTAMAGPSDAFVAQITEAALPPGPTTSRVSGGGTIDVAGGIANFHFIVQQQSGGAIGGRLQYFNHATGAKVRSATIDSLIVAGNTATFDGTCTVNGAQCTFTVNVTDNGEPGTSDTFTISVSGGPAEGGTLRSGNIKIISQ